MKLLEKTIKRNTNGDSRTAPTGLTFADFSTANTEHITDVRIVMNHIADLIRQAGDNHDYTKKSDEEQFYGSVMETVNEGKDFTQSDWFLNHIKEERHHLNNNYKTDVNLIDVLEMIVDVEVSRKARGIETQSLELSDGLLQLAFNNTIKMVSESLVLKE